LVLGLGLGLGLRLGLGIGIGLVVDLGALDDDGVRGEVDPPRQGRRAHEPLDEALGDELGLG
jgi:hypothetical protein